MAITFKKLSGDTEVIANPTLDGSETALSGLQIDGVKYAMGGGSKYLHCISMNILISGGVFGEIRFTLVLPNSEPITQDMLWNAIYSNYGGTPIQVTGAFYQNVNFGGPVYQITASSYKYITFRYLRNDHMGYTDTTLELNNNVSLQDKVIEV